MNADLLKYQDQVEKIKYNKFDIIALGLKSKKLNKDDQTKTTGVNGKNIFMGSSVLNGSKQDADIKEIESKIKMLHKDGKDYQVATLLSSYIKQMKN